MDKLGDFMNNALAAKGLSRTTGSAQICFWADEWGKGRFRPVSFSRGVLKLAVSSASAAQEISMDAEKLIKHLNSRIGHLRVESIRIENHF